MRGWLAADIGGTKLAVAAFDGERLYSRQEMPTASHRGADAVLADLVHMLKKSAAEAGITELKGIGVACPGPLSARQGVVIKAPMLGWENMPIVKQLEEQLHCPVCLENDANAAAYGEYRIGAGKDTESMAYVTVSTGVGCGIVANGKILSGFHEGAGEIGHLCLMPDGLPCACGRRGCLELYASGTAIGRFVSQKKGMEIAAREAATLAKLGDEDSIQAFLQAGEKLGIGLGYVLQLIDPECVVIGGSVRRSLDLMKQAIVEAVQRGSYWGGNPDKWLRVATLGDDSGLWGAALLAKNHNP